MWILIVRSFFFFDSAGNNEIVNKRSIAASSSLSQSLELAVELQKNLKNPVLLVYLNNVIYPSTKPSLKLFE